MDSKKYQVKSPSTVFVEELAKQFLIFTIVVVVLIFLKVLEVTFSTFIYVVAISFLVAAYYARGYAKGVLETWDKVVKAIEDNA
jgi:uncharacterized membrane protein